MKKSPDLTYDVNDSPIMLPDEYDRKVEELVSRYAQEIVNLSTVSE